MHSLFTLAAFSLRAAYIPGGPNTAALPPSILRTAVIRISARLSIQPSCPHPQGEARQGHMTRRKLLGLDQRLHEVRLTGGAETVPKRKSAIFRFNDVGYDFEKGFEICRQLQCSGDCAADRL